MTGRDLVLIYCDRPRGAHVVGRLVVEAGVVTLHLREAVAGASGYFATDSRYRSDEIPDGLMAYCDRCHGKSLPVWRTALEAALATGHMRTHPFALHIGGVSAPPVVGP